MAEENKNIFEQQDIFGIPKTTSEYSFEPLKNKEEKQIGQEYTTSVLKNFPIALNKNLEKIRNIPIFKGVREFLPPESEEEAIRSGLFPIKNNDGKIVGYADPTSAIGGIRRVGGKVADSIFSKIISKIGGKITPTKTEVRNIIKTGVGEKAAQKIQSQAYTSYIKANYNKAERELVPYILEGDEQAIKKATPKVKALAKEVKDYFDESFDFMSEHFDDISYRDNYVTHLWDIPKKKQADASKFFKTKNPFITKQRKYTTLKEGIEAGLKPKTTDIADILNIYDDWKINTVENKKIVDLIKKVVDDSGESVIKRIDKAPDDWVKVDHPALNRGMAKKTDDALLISKVPVAVNPEISREINSLFGKGFTGSGARALNTINAFTKKTALTLSLFHHFALTESGLASGLKKDLVKLWNPKNIYNAMKKGEYDVFKNIELSKDAVRNGLQLGSLSDASVGTVRQALINAEIKTKNIPGINKITGGIRTANDLWDKALWDYYHNGLKINTYENWVQQELKRLPDSASAQEIANVKKETAQLVNDTFGGQVWENFFLHPKAQQLLQWILLSPDWTLSTLRQAGAPLGLFDVAGKKGVRAKQGAAFWARAALYIYGGASVINYANTKKDDGEGKWLWENDKGFNDKIYMGRDEDGKKIYARPGKQFRELYEWIKNPFKKFGGKMTPALNEVVSQVTGSTITGWDKDWKGKDFWDSDALGARVKSFGELAVPYSIPSMAKSKSAAGLILPTSKANWTNTKEQFIKALEDNDKHAGMQIYKEALDNNIDAKTALDSAKSEIKYKKKMTRTDAENLVNEILKLPSNQRGEKVRSLIEDGTINEITATQIKTILDSKKRVLSEKKIFEKLNR